MTLKSAIGAGLLAGLVWGGAVVVRSQAAREWRYYGGDHAFTRYSPLDQINRDNVKNVQDRLAAPRRQPDPDQRLSRPEGQRVSASRRRSSSTASSTRRTRTAS